MSYLENSCSDIKNNIRISLISILIFICIYILILFFPLENDYLIWFQRSGSIIVTFAVFLEMWNNKIDIYLNPSGLTFSEHETFKNRFSVAYLCIKYFGFILAVIGTIIWGYGDLILKYFI
ncbi:MAG: hypothetical protein CL624_09025 [Arcobacter sp.]|nr:hypothetical protein [Arcobacter sp.]|tara:strand:- start:316 stop:678 length:363 start_codon:yes stop_codon:yes gene_type:complete